MFRHHLLIVLIVLSCATVFAQTPANAAPAPGGVVASLPDEATLTIADAPVGAEAGGTRAYSSFWAIVRMLVALAVVALAIYGVVVFIRRKTKPAELAESRLKILASAHLGSNRFVHVVSIGTKAWLIGAGDGSVSSLAELDDQELIDALLLEQSRRESEHAGLKQDFSSILRRLLGQKGTPGPGGLPGSDEIRRNRERLGRL